MLIIKSKDEIIVPFAKIGEDNWENNARKIIETNAENWGSDLPEPLTESAIRQLEERLGVALPHELRLFYKHFGLANIGETLLKLEKINWFNDFCQENFVEELELSSAEKEIALHLIVFSDCLSDGNMMCFHSKTQEAFYIDCEEKPRISKCFDSVSDYIKASLIFVQSEFCEEYEEQDTVEAWCREILHDCFEETMIKKWLF